MLLRATTVVFWFGILGKNSGIFGQYAGNFGTTYGILCKYGSIFGKYGGVFFPGGTVVLMQKQCYFWQILC